MSVDRRFLRPQGGAPPVRASGLARPGLGELRAPSGAPGPGPRRFKRGGGLRVKRRSRLLALLGNFLAAVLLVGVPVAGVVWLVTSPRFAVQHVEIVAAPADAGGLAGGRVGADWVARSLAPLEGENLLWLSLDRIEARLAGHPWVAGVEATKLPPDRLRVAVVERRAAALLDDGDGSWLWLDEDGRPIAPVGRREEVAADVLRLHWEGGRPPSEPGRRAALAGALETAGALAEARPDWGRGIDRIAVLGEEDFRFTGAALPEPLVALVVGPGSFGPRLAILDELLPELSRRVPDPAEVDLRFSHRIIVRPAQGPGEGEPYGTT